MAARRRRLGPSQSPVVSAAVTRIHRYSKAQSAIKWGAAGSVAMLAIVADMYMCFIAFLTDINQQFILLIESVLLLVLFLTVLYDIMYYLGTVMSNPGVKVTASQKTMLGIPGEVTGFNTVSTPIQFTTPAPSVRNLNKATPPIATPFSGTSPSYYHSPSSSHYSTPSYTPSNSSYHMYSSPNRSGTSPFKSDRISSRKSLESYLKNEEEKDQKNIHGSPDIISCQGHWSSSPVLRKYHVATRTLLPSEDDERDTDSLWSRLHVKKDELNEWTGRCRKWLAQTVIIPVSKEIKSVNKALENMGSREVTIGVTNLNQLRDVARLRTMLLPSLNMLICYLNVSTRQDYLVKRIHELAEGGSIVNYKWDSGGSWKGRKWDQDLPSDSQIVLHFLCTYLDSQIPPSPQFPDGKTFSSQYFLKTPDKPENKKATVALYQSSINPPHYKVLWKDSCIEIPKGRNNLFHAVIVFLHYVKHEEKGLLGHLDLQLSDLNLLWIIGNGN